MRNLRIEGGPAGAGPKAEHLNGALTFSASTDVVVSACTLSCPDGAQRAQACLLVRGVGGPEPDRVRDRALRLRGGRVADRHAARRRRTRRGRRQSRPPAAPGRARTRSARESSSPAPRSAPSRSSTTSWRTPFRGSTSASREAHRPTRSSSRETSCTPSCRPATGGTAMPSSSATRRASRSPAPSRRCAGRTAAEGEQVDAGGGDPRPRQRSGPSSSFATRVRGTSRSASASCRWSRRARDLARRRHDGRRSRDRRRRARERRAGAQPARGARAARRPSGADRAHARGRGRPGRNRAAHSPRPCSTSPACRFPAISVRFAVTGANPSRGGHRPRHGRERRRAVRASPARTPGTDTITAYADTNRNAQAGRGRAVRDRDADADRARAGGGDVRPGLASRRRSARPPSLRRSFAMRPETRSSSVSVRFHVSGREHRSPRRAVTTGADGRAAFSYTGTHVGTDTVTAVVGSGSGAADGHGDRRLPRARCPASVVVAPAESFSFRGAQHCVIATVTDRAGTPIAGAKWSVRRDGRQPRRRVADRRTRRGKPSSATRAPTWAPTGSRSSPT